jgi:hypothetical protein
MITTSGMEQMLSRNPQLIKHEEAHTWQYLYCLGLYYIPYVIFTGWSVIRTGDRAAELLRAPGGTEHGGHATIR